MNDFMCSRLGKLPGCRHIFLFVDMLLCVVQRYLDSSFDRKHGIDASGVIPLKDLTINSRNVHEGVWYEPMSVKAFRQMMSRITINFNDFEFIDFGSGKGRVLFLASEYGFRKIIGVEFSQELHRAATENIETWNRCYKMDNIETICMDAIEFPLPLTPLVIFFYSPFRGKVMEQVLSNVTTSFKTTPRKILLIYYGHNSETIKLIQATNFKWNELDLRPDWSRFIQYRGFIFTSP